MRPPGPHPRGTTLVELLVAMGLVALVMSTVALLAVPVLGSLEADPASAEAAQRGRGLLLALFDDVHTAGSGFVLATDRGPGLGLPAVWPDTLTAGAWAFGARPQVLSAWHARRDASHAVLRQPVAAGAVILPLGRPTLCPAAWPTCGFGAGDEVLVYDAHGRLAVGTVQQVLPPLDLEIVPPLAEAWPAGTVVSGVRAHTYELRPDPATGLSQVVRRVGTGPATPVIDFVTRFDVTWWAAAGVPAVRGVPGAEDDATSGPAPPAVAAAEAPGWPPGENCAYARDAGGAARWRGGASGASPEVLPLGALADGPWCPSPAAAVRWDADLARLAEVRVVVGVAAAGEVLRVPASLGLRRPGARLVPDLVLEATLRPGRRNGGL